MANKTITSVLKISVIVWLFCVTLSAPTVFAQSTGDPTMLPDGRTIQTPGVVISTESTPQQYVPLAPIDTDPGIYRVNNFGAFLNGMMKILISLGAVLAVLLIVIGGFQYITSASEGGKGSAKERIENALIGLAILLGSYLILNTINPDLVNTQLIVQQIAPSGLGATQSTGGILPADLVQRETQLGRRVLDAQSVTTINRPEFDSQCTAQGGRTESRVISGQGDSYVCVQDLTTTERAIASRQQELSQAQSRLATLQQQASTLTQSVADAQRRIEQAPARSPELGAARAAKDAAESQLRIVNSSISLQQQNISQIQNEITALRGQSN